MASAIGKSEIVFFSDVINTSSVLGHFVKLTFLIILKFVNLAVGQRYPGLAVPFAKLSKWKNKQ